MESKITLSGQSDACDTTVRSRVPMSVLSVGWEALGEELLAVAALLGSTVDRVSWGRGEEFLKESVPCFCCGCTG